MKAAVAELAGGGRARVIAACGTGKTDIGAAVAVEVAWSGLVLVVVPNLVLLAQTAAAWHRRRGGRFAAVCCDHAALEDGEVNAELELLQAEVCTDPARVAQWLAETGPLTVLTTYHSLPVIAEAHAGHGAACWDLIVVDEAHRSAGRSDRAWNIVHDDQAIPARRRLYLTATPRIMASERHETASMDDPVIFGPEVFRLSFGEAIEAGLLADYRVVVAVVTDSEVATMASEQQASVSADGGPAVPARMLAAQIALLKAAARYDLRRIITYHHRVLTARRFSQTLLCAADLLPQGGRPTMIRAEAVDGTMTPAQRREVMRHLRRPSGRTVVVANARVLAEGVDVPELDAVMFCDPRDSATDVVQAVVQAVGRALRRSSATGKIATIIVPIVLADGESPEAALEGSAFDGVWRVVRALRAHDERLADQRVQQSRAARPQAAGNSPQVPWWLEVMGTWVGETFAHCVLVRAITTASSAWAVGYTHAVDYRAGHGHLDVPSAYRTADDYPLGSWIVNQRTRRRKRRLNGDQIAKLDELGIGWGTPSIPWRQGYDHAVAYRNTHGHLAAPTDYESPDGHPLGLWLSGQRRRRNRGSLAADQITALDALGMVWDAREHRWQQAYQAARAFRGTRGHLDITSKHVTGSGLRLGSWLAQQRLLYRQGELAPARAAALEDLGIVWDMSGWAWDRGYAATLAYHADRQSLNMPEDYRSPSGLHLAQWLQARRSSRAAGQLSAQHIAALDKLGIDWNPNGSTRQETGIPPPDRTT